MATEAARKVIAYGFHPIGSTQIIAATDLSKRASVGVMERLGMVYWRTDDATLYYQLLP